MAFGAAWVIAYVSKLANLTRTAELVDQARTRLTVVPAALEDILGQTKTMGAGGWEAKGKGENII